MTPPGEDPPACCVYGYIYYNDEPVSGAWVHLQSAHGELGLVTTAGAVSTEPYYSADLVSVPLLVSPGDIITITAEYGDMVSTRTWTVQSDGQHVDLGLVPGYQATEPVPYPIAGRFDAATPAGNGPLDTTVGGPITTDTTWTQAGSPYIATSSVLVENGVTLTIEPGVEVRFDGNYSLQVDGQLIARGTATDPITFTANVAPGWGYILFSDSSVDAVYDVSGTYVSGSILEYAVVEYAGHASVSNNAAVRMDDAHPLISNCTIRDSQAAGISAWDLSGTLRITDSTIDGNGASGVEASFLAGTVEVLNSTISNNGASGIWTTALNNAGGGSGSVSVLNNVIASNSGHGVYFWADYYNAAQVVVSGNTISKNSSDRGGAIYVYYYEYKWGEFKTIEISRNLIYGNSASERGGGIWFDYGCAECGTPGSTITISNNVISGNVATINGGGIWAGRGVAMIANNAVVGNTSGNSSAICFCSSDFYEIGDWTLNTNTIVNNRATGSGSYCAVYARVHPRINQNSVFSNVATYELWNGNAEGSADVDAENNWWGTSNSGEIAAAIYDWFDDPTLGIVDYNPYLASPDTNAPISPPAGLAATPSGSAINLSWSPNLESDRAGYKVYYDSDGPGFPYDGTGANEGASPIDVGNVTSFSLTGLPAGTYHVSVTAYDTAADGTDDWTDGNESWFAPDQEVLLQGPLQADFSASPTSGVAPLTVDFVDASTGNVQGWNWDFGDGGSSTQQNPAHTYDYGGTYTVSLTVDGPEGSDTETKPDYITVDYAPPSADFGASPLAGSVPLTTTFSDASTGPLTTWDWDFGDGGTSGARYPEHIYTNPGTYTVSLTVAGPGGSDTETKPGYITASPAGLPIATIDSITPNPAVQGQDLVYLNGSAHDTDEDGAYITAYLWASDLDGELSTQEDFTVEASELSVGTHTISFQAQDNEGYWSLEDSAALTVQAAQADVRSMVLINHQRLANLYGSAQANQVMAKVEELAADDRVRGLVVQVENDPAVAAAYAAWDADPTSTAQANTVAATIKGVVDAQWAAHPNLEYLVIVGDDRVIPFRRVLDQTRYPEGNYGYVSPTTITGAALHDDMTLTDDYYADAVPTIPDDADWDGHELYIPDLGSGRLIETPGEVVAQIDTFLTDDEVTASEAMVTGYDFLQDGARAMCNELSGDGIPTDCSLIGSTWDRDDFIATVLNTRHAIASINGHAAHYVIGTPSGTIYSSDVTAATADHSRALFYTVGCHSGLNVSPANPYSALDAAQALVQKQANYVANTGFGWGYVTAVGLSEQLMLDFTERLAYGQSATVGQALAAAKQEYYLNEGSFDYYDEKILIESTLYGLPMYRFVTAEAQGMGQDDAQQEGTLRQEVRSTVLGNGLTVNSFSYQFPALTAETTPQGLYYTLGDLMHAADGEPIQPKYVADLSFPQTEAHGVVFRGGVYTDVTSFDPVVDRAITETYSLTEPSFAAPSWYPLVLPRLNRLEGRGKLVTLLGQFNPQNQEERIYDRLSFDVYYHTTSGDWTAPSIREVRSHLDAETAAVSVQAEDASGIVAVVVAYTDGNGAWESASLTGTGGTWSGSFPAGADTAFFVQVVDRAGNVAVAGASGRYLTPGEGSTTTVYLPVVARND